MQLVLTPTAAFKSLNLSGTLSEDDGRRRIAESSPAPRPSSLQHRQQITKKTSKWPQAGSGIGLCVEIEHPPIVERNDTEGGSVRIACPQGRTALRITRYSDDTSCASNPDLRERLAERNSRHRNQDDDPNSCHYRFAIAALCPCHKPLRWATCRR